MAYNLHKRILGAFASFVEVGAVFGDPVNTVGAELYPNADPYPELWNSLGCVIDASPEVEVETDEDFCPSPAGGYVKETTQSVVQDILKLSLKTHSEPIERLIWGASAAIVDQTQFTPFAAKDRFIAGWLHLQLREQGGTDTVVAALYGKLRLDAAPKWSKDPTKPAVKFEILYSSVATVLPDGISG